MKLKGCGKLESEFFVPVGSDSARKKNVRAEHKHPCGERIDAGIHLCGSCARRPGVEW